MASALAPAPSVVKKKKKKSTGEKEASSYGRILLGERERKKREGEWGAQPASGDRSRRERQSEWSGRKKEMEGGQCPFKRELSECAQEYS